MVDVLEVSNYAVMETSWYHGSLRRATTEVCAVIPRSFDRATRFFWRRDKRIDRRDDQLSNCGENDWNDDAERLVASERRVGEGHHDEEDEVQDRT